MEASLRTKLSRSLKRGNVLKRTVRRLMNELLNSPALRVTPSREHLQRAHAATMAGIHASSKQGRLHGKVAVITGGSSGLGRATALLFAREGAKVVVADLKPGAVDEITAAGGEALFVQADLLVNEAVESMVQQVIAAYGRIDILINNAGVTIPGSVTDISPEKWQLNIDINLTSVYRVSYYAIPHMVQSGAGSIVNTASIQGVVGIKEFSAYAAAKGGIISLTRQMAQQYANAGIRVNCVSPGVIITPIFEHADNVSEMTRIVSDYTPLGILGVPEDIAYLNLFLASDESSYITGINVVADGGITMRGM